MIDQDKLTKLIMKNGKNNLFFMKNIRHACHETPLGRFPLNLDEKLGFYFVSRIVREDNPLYFEQNFKKIEDLYNTFKKIYNKNIDEQIVESILNYKNSLKIGDMNVFQLLNTILSKKKKEKLPEDLKKIDAELNPYSRKEGELEIGLNSVSDDSINRLKTNLSNPVIGYKYGSGNIVPGNKTILSHIEPMYNQPHKQPKSVRQQAYHFANEISGIIIYSHNKYKCNK